MRTKIISYLLVLVLVADLGYSFLQHYSQPLDGDMPSLLVPAPDVQFIFDNPLGVGTIINDESYQNPNRFFCHWMYREYMITIPILIQNFSEPIESVYLSCAIAKTTIQFAIILLLAFAISNTRKIFSTNFLISAVLITPLFQTNGYTRFIGIIDTFTTYTFFYAFPCALIILYFLPFVFEFYYNKKPLPRLFICFIWIPFALVVSLHGALNPGIALVFSSVVLLNYFIYHYSKTSHATFIKNISNTVSNIPLNYWLYLLPICLFSFYSLYLGSYNSYSIQQQIPLSEMYKRLPEGLYNITTQKLAYIILLLILVFNSILIYRNYYNSEGNKILKTFVWIGIFILIYTLLLPLGGFREYRYNIIRYDTFIPITLSLLFIYGRTTIFLINNISKRQKMWYLPLIMVVLLIYTNADKPGFGKNDCERKALNIIANSTDQTIIVDANCEVLSWKIIEEPYDSEMNTRLLNMWGIIKDEKLYYQK